MDEKAQMEAAAQKMNQMNPETLKAQAAALRGMSPSEVRTMNPQMAGFSDSQILEAADQMEEMANDPALIKAAADELKNMSPEQMADIKRTMNGGSVQTSGGGGGGANLQAASTVPGLPVGTRVVLHGLQAAPQFNGKTGTVKSGVNEKGRQNVLVDGEEKALLLRPTNLQPESRALEDLSASELKAVLCAKGVGPETTNELGQDRLLELVEEHVMPDDDLALLCAQGAQGVPAALKAEQEQAKAAAARAAASRNAAVAKMEQAMNPDILRNQAKQLRAMTPAEVRQKVPNMAGLSDEQILKAADEMEQMANDPAMRQRQLDEMKRMSPAQIEQMKREMGGGGGGGGRQSPEALRAQAKQLRYMVESGQGDKVRAHSPRNAHMNDEAILATAGQMEAAAAAAEAARSGGGGGGGGGGGIPTMPNPEALKANAHALRQAIQAGHGDRVRQSNAQMASLSDAQILAAADQMEMVAGNPQMMAAAQQQMKSMTPEQLDEAKKQALAANSGGGGLGGGASAGAGAGTGAASAAPSGSGGGDGQPPSPANLLSMNPAQLKLALSAMKNNPEMAKQAIQAMPGAGMMSEAQLTAQLDQLSAMDDKQLEQFLNYASTAQGAMLKARKVWDGANSLVGGHLVKVLGLAGVAVVGLAVRWLFFSAGGGVGGGDGSGGGIPLPSEENEYNAEFSSSSGLGSGGKEGGAGVNVGVGAMGEMDEEFS